MLKFRAISDSGSSEMEFPASLSSSDPTGVIEKFVALPGSSEQWYDFTLLSAHHGRAALFHQDIDAHGRSWSDQLPVYDAKIPKKPYRRLNSCRARAGCRSSRS